MAAAAERSRSLQLAPWKLGGQGPGLPRDGRGPLLFPFGLALPVPLSVPTQCPQGDFFFLKAEEKGEVGGAALHPKPTHSVIT